MFHTILDSNLFSLIIWIGLVVQSLVIHGSRNSVTYRSRDSSLNPIIWSLLISLSPWNLELSTLELILTFLFYKISNLKAFTFNTNSLNIKYISTWTKWTKHIKKRISLTLYGIHVHTLQPCNCKVLFII